MTRYRTLIDNPWSRRGEIIEDHIGSVITMTHSQEVYASHYPSIWQPIEEEVIEKLPSEVMATQLMEPEYQQIAKYVTQNRSKIQEMIDTLNSLTQRVKRLEEK